MATELEKNDQEKNNQLIQYFREVLVDNISDRYDASVIEEALPVAIGLYKVAKSYYLIEEKAKNAAKEFALNNRWREAQSAVVVSEFFRRNRLGALQALRNIGGDPYRRPNSEISEINTLEIIKKAPFLQTPPEKENDEDSLWDILRRYGEF